MRPRRRGPALLLVLALLAAAVLASILIGANPLSPARVWHALAELDDPVSPDGVIVADRVRRTVVGVVIGASLAAAGAAMQGVTRNPLGDPGILGINAGAAATVVLGITLLGISGTMAIAVWALIGAGLAAVVVYAIASIGREGATPIKLALVGAAFSAGAASLTSAMNLQHQETLDSFRRWQLGALTRASYADVLMLLPMVLLGLLLTVGMARSVNSFALGDDMARALGTRVGPARALVFVGVTLLCGAAVALAGPIAFVGLMVPHAVRSLTGPDYRWILPLSALAGPVVLLLADAVGRVVLPPTEVEVGVSMAVVGVPVFLAMIRSRKAMSL
ncbi:FecCD family ABC transporter permease [Rothia kristinae]|uniref:FecCD family ABC transporter permease n=1 Tax=Rothia kristinae TaxID=37923 RepID=UPI001E2ED346|nr:iron ABC transporter permease [Rothia kristinae]